MRTVSILGADPGVANYGYCILRIGVENSCIRSLKVEQFGKLNTTLRSMVKAEFSQQMLEYRLRIKELMQEFSTAAFIAERFQTRGNGGPTIELISAMLGATSVDVQDSGGKVRLIIASQWKTAFKRNCGDLQVVYDRAKEEKISPHEVDAFLISVYGAYLIANSVPFTGIYIEKVIETLLMYRDRQIHIGESVKRVRKKTRRR